MRIDRSVTFRRMLLRELQDPALAREYLLQQLKSRDWRDFFDYFVLDVAAAIRARRKKLKGKKGKRK